MTKKISVTLPDSLAEDLRQIAESERRSLSVTIELLLIQAVVQRDKRRKPPGRRPDAPQPRLAMVDWEADDDAPSAA